MSESARGSSVNRLNLLLLALLVPLLTVGCPPTADDDDVANDDDVTADDDDTGPDDDDTGPDDDDTGPDDDDTGPDDDDTGPDDDDATGDDDDTGPNDDDSTGDDDDTGPDDDDSTGDDDDTGPDDDDSTGDDDDTGPDDDDSTGDDDDSANACVLDPYEPNDTQGEAYPAATGTLADPHACPGDDDWYAIALTAGAVLDVTAVFTHTEGNLDLELHNESGALLADSLTSTDDEALSYTAGSDEVVYVRAFIAFDLGGQVGVPYELQFVATGLGCTSDAFEPNDSQGQAQPLPIGPTPGLTTCGDDDWYSLALSGGENLSLIAAFPHSEGNIDVYLVDAVGNTLETGDSFTDNESVSYTAPGAETVYVRVVLTTDLGSTPGNSYGVNVVVGVATCNPDGEEPNNDAGSASPLSVGTLASLTSCPSDPDWYSFSVTAGQGVDVGANFDNSEGNINLTLRDSTGGVLASATSGDDNEFLSYSALADEDLLLEVSLFADAGAVPGNEYELSLNVSAPTCPSDSFEPNDTFGGAAIITATDYTSLAACDGDDDWYQLGLLTGEDVTFEVSFPAAEGNIDIELSDASGSVVATSNGSGDTESINYVANANEPVFLRVFLTLDAGSSPGNGYELSITGVAPSCVPDAFEPNEDSASATPVAAGSYGNLTICPADADWYQIDLATGDTLDLDILFDHDEGDMALEVFDSSMNSVGSANTGDDDETLTVGISGDDTYFIAVGLFSDAGSVPGNIYSLDVAVVTLVCPTDTFEPNDSDTDPAPVSPGTYTGLSACSSDDDFYAIDLLAGDIFSVDALFSHADGDIDIALLDSGGAPIDDSITTDDNESLSYTVGADGTYFVVVNLAADFGDLGNGYTLLLATSSSVCEPDDLEPNDDLGSAVLLAPDVYDELTACSSDEDWYELNLPVGASLDLTVFHAFAEGDIDVVLYDDAQGILGSGATINDDETISLTTPYSGVYFVQVVLVSDTGALPGNPYTLSISLPPVPCAYDSNEPDDDFTLSNPLTPDGAAGLSVCPTDSDWFVINTGPADSFTVDVLFSHPEGDVDITLYDAQVAVLETSDSTDNNEQVSFTATGPTTLLLEVYLAQDAGLIDGNPYSIEVTGLSEICLPDTLETDNEIALANVAFDEDVFTGSTSCPADNDFFAIDLANGDALEVLASFDNAEGDIDLNLYDPSTVYLTSAFSVTDDELLTWTANTDGTHYLEVVLASDNGVTPGNSYDIEFDLVSTICLPDSFEPNESLQDAAAVTAGTYADLTSCGDPDWFEIALGAGESLNLDVLFEHAEGDIDITLYDDGATVLMVSDSSDDDEGFVFNAGAAGTYFVEVELVADTGPDAGNSYDLSFTTATINCTADAFEPNDSQGSPVTLVLGNTPGLVACPTDLDWFNFSVTSGEIITVLAQFDIADGDANLQLIDPLGALVATASNATSNETIIHAATETGTYLLGVEFVTEGDPPDGVEYTLDLAVSLESCLFDWAEDNDTFVSPTLVEPGENPHLVVCETDEDWFTVNVPEGSILDLDLIFSHAEGDIDFFLYDSTLTFVGSRTSSDDNESISYEAPPTTGGDHYLQVQLVNDTGSLTGNPYSLNYGYSDTSGCPVDSLEDNDTLPGAGFISLGTYPNQSICETDEDWFGMALAPGDTINVDLVFDHADGDIDIELLDDTLTQVDLGNTSTDNESVTYTSAAGGGMVLHITMPLDDVNGNGNSYDMAITGTTAACNPDAFEEDDVFADAAPLPEGASQLRACPSDDDWSLVLLAPGETATWTASFAHAEGDVDLQLYSASSSLIDSATSLTDNETLSYQSTEFGYYYVVATLVTDAGNPGNPYTMDLTIN
jgi:hypothetical protein